MSSSGALAAGHQPPAAATALCSTLNPYAASFVPRATPPEKVEVEQPSLGDLPTEVLAQVASNLSVASDIASFGMASKGLLRAVQDASFCLDVACPPASPSPPDLSERLDLLVKGIVKYCPGTTELRLSHQPVEDRQVEVLLRSLPKLRSLDLSGCRKLTPAFATALGLCSDASDRLVPGWGPESSNDSSVAAFGGPGRSCRELRVLNAQRCYQLHGAALSELLRHAAAKGSRLRCLALSHLDLASWPSTASPALAPAGPGVGSALRVLVLTNCSKLGAPGLDALAQACPGLEYLFLGGSTYQYQPQPPQQSSLAEVTLGDNIPGLAVAPSLSPAYSALLSECWALLPACLPCGPAVAAPGDAPPAAAAAMAGVGVQLAAAVLLLPRLRALEVTFVPAAAREALCHVLGRRAGSAPGGTWAAPAVWDFCKADSVQQAAVAVAQFGCGSGGTATAKQREDKDALALAVHCAANCSSASRASPLHCAAAEGSGRLVRLLLGVGAAPAARDASRSTPLFLACEGGHTAAAEPLLAAGGGAQVSNTAGETPLYIAALKGHVAVVQQLLSSLVREGVAWQDPLLYGDRWTPLMACAVANRLDVALCLLRAAGASAPKLVAASNRYGQTVMHIAARKASLQLLQLLMEHGGRASLHAPDKCGDTPLDIARQNRHHVALVEFRRLCARC